MLMITLLVDPIRTSFWRHISKRWNFLGKKLQNANIIAESMNAQCDTDRNEYHLLEGFVDHRKNGSALTVKDLKIVFKGQKYLESQQLVGIFVENGRTAPHHERSYPI